MDKTLIYDVGAHNGDDTAFYLANGYSVLAVEPDHSLANQVRDRFAAELQSGQLTFLEVAVGPRSGRVPLWKCASVSQWNSLDEAFAGRLGLLHHPLWVICVRAKQLFRRFGVPYYMKVDIEGYDRYCVEDVDEFDAPDFVSVELDGIDDLISLRKVGYCSFKLIHQGPSHRHRQFRSAAAFSGASIDQFPSETSRHSLERAPRPGPSGPFGPETDGTWLGFEETAYDILSFKLGRSGWGDPPPWSVWLDLHAAREPRPPPASKMASE
jgi:FkbM family methyltransferase